MGSLIVGATQNGPHGQYWTGDYPGEPLEDSDFAPPFGDFSGTVKLALGSLGPQGCERAGVRRVVILLELSC
jgi:hypothetical protein